MLWENLLLIKTVHKENYSIRLCDILGIWYKCPTKSNAPHLFVAAATDDGLGPTSQSVALYSKWLAAKKLCEIHIYEQGGNGFGMHHQYIPTDTWIDRFVDWLGLLGYFKAK